MPVLPADLSPVRLSTDDLPERDRLPVWREFYGRLLFRTEMEPATDVAFHADVTVRGAPGLEAVSSTMSPGRLLRTPALAADGNDDVGLCVSSAGGALVQFGREIAYGPGDAVVSTATEAATWTSPGGRFRCLHMRRAELAPLVTGLDPKALLRRVAPACDALRYLLGYARFVEEIPTPATADVARAVAVHMRDLFALVLGASRDAAVLAEGRGLRAARLQAIKRHIERDFGDGGLGVETVARAHRVTPRCVQRLFESEGTTFSKYLLDRRLARVRRMLADPACAGRTVSAIALEAGFGDVSYFNRRFRRRCGMSPSDARAQAQEEGRPE
jgi:AraC-like DNA-binding protein